MSILQYLLFSGASILEFKHAVYNGFHIYAVKRANANMTMFSGLYDNEALPSWWCGYVELAPGIYKDFHLDDSNNPNGVYRSSKQELYEPHGGFTYIDEGIPGLEAVHGDYLGWDYNHFGDHTGQPTVEEIFREGRKVIDSIESKSNTEKDEK